MYTQCPECLTVYRVGPHPVAEGRGRLRCGHCGGVFDALATLTEQLPAGAFQVLPSRHAAELPPVMSVPAMHPGQARSDGQREPVDSTPDASGRIEPRLPGEWLAAADMSAVPSHSPDRANFSARPSTPAAALHADPRTPRSPAKGTSAAATARPTRNSAAPVREWLVPPPEQLEHRRSQAPPDPPSAGWGWACLLLSGLLIGQLVFVEKERLLAQPELRSWLQQACDQLNCELPLPRDLTSLSLLKREVRPHEHLKGALQISATMHNGGTLPTRFPLVEVRLADLNDRVIAMRRFRPEEYLADTSVIARGFPAKSSLPLLFEVADPGREALAFEFEFLAPP